MSQTWEEAAARASITAGSETWELRLYVAGQTPRCLAAFSRLKALCEEHVPGRYHIEVVDLLEDTQLAEGDEILAVPTVIRKLPPPIRKVVGDLADTERALIGLQIRPTRPRESPPPSQT